MAEGRISVVVSSASKDGYTLILLKIQVNLSILSFCEVRLWNIPYQTMFIKCYLLLDKNVAPIRHSKRCLLNQTKSVYCNIFCICWPKPRTVWFTATGYTPYYIVRTEYQVSQKTVFTKRAFDFSMADIKMLTPVTTVKFSFWKAC